MEGFAPVITAVIGVLIFLLQPRSDVFVLVMTACYGALAYTLYSIAVAHANDFAKPDEFVKVSGGLLLLFGIGTVDRVAAAHRLHRGPPDAADPRGDPAF